MRTLAITIALLAIGAEPTSKESGPVDVVAFLQQLPKEYRPDSKGVFDSYSLQKANDWLADHGPGTIVKIAFTVKGVYGPEEDPSRKFWRLQIVPVYEERKIFNAPATVEIRDRSLIFKISDAQAKSASKWKDGKKIVVQGQIARVYVGLNVDDQIMYVPQPDSGSLNDSIYRFDLRDCSFEAGRQ